MTGLLNLADLAKLYGSSDEQKKTAAWSKLPSTGVLSEWRYDCDGRLVCWSEYGKYTEHGWQIDHITPSAIGGSDGLANLRARHWRGNSVAGTMLGGLLGTLGRKAD